MRLRSVAERRAALRAAQDTFEEDQEREEGRQSDLFHELFGHRGGGRDREVGVRHKRHRHEEEDDYKDEREGRRRSSGDRYLPGRYY